MARYWLYEWLDVYGVDSIDKAVKVLSDHRSIESLREHATSSSEPTSDGISILAGRGVDLSGQLGCNHAACRRKDVEKLFGRTWHYFDRIVVQDAVAHELIDHRDAPLPDLRKWLLHHFDVILYLRTIGAEDLVEFRPRQIPCEVHWQRHAEEAGLAAIVESVEKVAAAMHGNAEIACKNADDGSVQYALNHPNFEHTQWGHIRRDELAGLTASQQNLAICRQVVQSFVPYLASDVAAARSGRVPLGTTLWVHSRLMDGPGERTASEAEVAFDVRLPVLEGVSIADLIALRDDERPCFERFRARLRTAIQERLAIATSERSLELGREIVRDVIDPEVRHIEERLRLSATTLTTKAAVGVGLGAVVTTCGLIAGATAGASVLAGVGAVAAAGIQAAGKDLDERREIELSDMYFLWKAAHQLPHAHHD
jgi:hypothetical protein